METTGSARSEQASPTTVRIVEAVAAREGVDPLELSPPLYDVIDPEAIETLLTDPDTGETREGIRLEFTYYGYEITVEGTDLQVSAR